MLYGDQLKEMRENILDEVRALLPGEQEYMNLSLAMMPTIKWLDQNGEISYPNGTGLFPNTIQPSSIDEMPIESLAELLVALRARKPKLCIFFQVCDNKHSTVVREGKIATNTRAEVNGLQLAQKIRELAFVVTDFRQNDPEWPLTVHAHLTENQYGHCIPDSPTLKLSCR